MLQQQTLSTLLFVEFETLLSGAAVPCFAPASCLVLSAEGSGRQCPLCHLTVVECQLTCISHRADNAKRATQAAGVQN